jgi:hypothetical protein
MIDVLKIQQGIWEVLSAIEGYEVVDFIEYDSIEPPFIHIGSIYMSDDSVKNNEGLMCQQYINIYSTYDGKKEVLEMINVVSEAMKGITIDGHSIHVKQEKTSIIVDKDRFSSIFQRTDRNNNKFYHAVLVFELYINE